MARTAGLAGALLIFSSPTFWTRFGFGEPPYALVTVVFGCLITYLVITWPQTPRPSAFPGNEAFAIAAALGALVLTAAGIHRWMQAMLWQPLDPARGDMLAVVEAAIRAVLRGRDPYAVYQVPWNAPLPYGPVLWAPFLLPHLLQADLRLITIAGEAFFPLCCGVAAVVEAARGRRASSAAWLVVLTVVVFTPELATFTTVGHTPAYWPLIPLFALFVAAGHWNPAAVVLALLVAGRSTMVAIVPVYFMAVWWRSRPMVRSALVLFAAALAVLFLPFFAWDPAAMWDGMVASYPRVMKGIVWVSPDGGATKTIGVTGWLLAHQLQALVEPAQLLTLGAVYVMAWRYIGSRGAAPLPWMVLALLAFSMTALWPVYYVYFDVLLLLISGAAAASLNVNAPAARMTAGWAACVVVAALLVAAALMVEARLAPAAEFSTGGGPVLYKGFVASTGELSGSAAIWGTEGSLSLPRRRAAPAVIVMHVHPVIPVDTGPQALTAVLNGALLGTAHIGRGWSDITFDVPASAWRAGANRLDLQCASASVPREVGLGDDGRHISLAIRRIEVVPK